MKFGPTIVGYGHKLQIILTWVFNRVLIKKKKMYSSNTIYNSIKLSS